MNPIMTPLLPFSLPLQDQPPLGYGWEGRDLSVLSTTHARRDKFLGSERCIVCGFHIVGQEIWSDLRRRGWVPSQTAEEPQDDSRNGLILCTTHSIGFENYYFFIRFFPDVQKFVFINHFDQPEYERFHGKAVALDIKDPPVPFPSLLIIHEIRARNFHPLCLAPVNPGVPSGGHWQNWIFEEEVYDDDSHSFRRNWLPRSSVTTQLPHQLPPEKTSTGGMSSCARRLELNDSVITDILAASRAMPSWRACEEGL